MTGMNPPDTSLNLPLIIWDILNYKGIPTNTLSAFANNFLASGISSSGLGTYDASKTFNATSTKINLPNSYSYSNADAYTNNSTGSSAEVWFGYDVRNKNNTSYRLWPQSRIQYWVSYNGNFPIYLWTNYAGVQHTVN
ncbi:hypothetical protein Dtox_1763 [Desulfofarcimen acetoxidans DSM 771]|uniref:Uncharacterized protein n=1 Tax=Desulfofarcimen acetoxidans (strain ATCC 49208 / DSM 771 / KCTC 5769 / VKM B-1644 / 5575) TaxID=485916 RepID=C8VX43_DESAS|nr:hypothetical protein [Desulfofarcimen acetoxidans]ACV62619.1 hypothetical protein Dtox_1763 [Desulfofarcimen acetoxidans DSM 771]